MAHPWLMHIKQDVIGGAVSASVAIPLALGYGMFAFVALGDAYFAVGLVAGLISATVVGFASVLMNDQSKMIYAPRIVSTFFIGALLRGMVQSNAEIFQHASNELIATILLLIILLAGAFQFLFGLIRMGSLLKHTPYTVLAGFQNAAAILLFLVQIGNVLGLPKQAPISQLFNNLPNVRPLSLIVGVTIFGIMWYAKRLLPKIPPVITALTAGTALYYLLVLAGLSDQLGPVIGEGKFFSFGVLALPEFFKLGANPKLLEILPLLISGALGLAFIASLDALLCAKILEDGSSTRDDSDRQLRRLGVGNMLSASAGGITSGINLGPSLINRAFGAKTPLSALVNAALVLLTIAVLLPLLSWLPRVALSAVIMVIAIQHLDTSTLPLIKRLITGKFSDRRSMAIDLAVISVVTVLAIALNIVTAVFIGIFIAVMLFVLRMSRSVVRSEYTCDLVRSRKRRDPVDDALLSEKAANIHVLALEGAIFFGTADKLLDGIETVVKKGARCVILDLRHVTDIDSTGARMMLEIFDKLRKQRIPLLISHLKSGSHRCKTLADAGLLAALAPDKLWHDTDRAIEWAEDFLIIEERGKVAEQVQALEQQAIFRGLDQQETRLACATFTYRRYDKGAVLFRQGDPGREMFIIGSGSASVHLPDSDGGTTRLITFSAGTLFGEIAILDRQPRSATVVADGELDCYVLEEEAFDALKIESPSIAIQLLINLATQMATHLRNNNRTIYQLAR